MGSGTSRRFARTRLAAALLALAAGACVLPVRHGDDGPVRPEGTPPPEADTSHLAVAPVMTEPLDGRRNVVWSAGLQLAWDALSTFVDPKSGIEVDRPAALALVRELAVERFPPGDLDTASTVVESGFVRSGVVDRFRRRVEALGGRVSIPIPTDDPTDIAALAYVRKDLPFAHPFHVHEKSLRFAGGPARVVAFGIDPEAHGTEVEGIAKQAVEHLPADAGSSDLAIELLPRDDADRIVLAAMEPPATLSAAWDRARSLLDRPGEPLGGRIRLEVPKVDFATTRVFDELVGAPVVNLPSGSKIRDVRERIEMTLSERGARFVTTASAVASCSAPVAPKVIRFDRPFLLALVRKGATRPYFAAWFENDDLFVRRPER